MTFHDWLLSNYGRDVSLIGAQATAVQAADEKFTRAWSFRRNRASVQRLTPGDAMLGAFMAAWEAYKAYKAYKANKAVTRG